MKTCDLCGRQARNLWFVQNRYQVDGVAYLCKSCTEKLGKICDRAHGIYYPLAERQKTADVKEWLRQQHYCHLKFGEKKS